MGASFDLRIYVAVTSPYPWNRGVTVEVSKTLENTVELEGPMFLDVVTRPSENWLLNSLVTQMFLQLVIQKKEYMKRNLEMNIVDKVNMVDKEFENLTRGT